LRRERRMTIYRNKKTGAELRTETKLKGDWEEVKEAKPKAEKKQPEEKAEPAKKKGSRKK